MLYLIIATKCSLLVKPTLAQLEERKTVMDASS